MTEFIGPREGWDEHIAGTIRFELDVELWSNPGPDTAIHSLAGDVVLERDNRCPPH